MIPIYNGKRKGILVVSGGGIKGLSALGAISRLIEENIINKPDILCGTSAGAMIVFLMNVGYKPDEIFYLLLNIDFNNLIIYDVENLFDTHLGINNPEPFKYILQKMIEKKNFNPNINFLELYNLTKQKLIITGTCVNTSSIHYFSYDLTPNMSVLDAVQISIAMPFIFKPFKYDNKIWIDGGCMNNYPIDLFHNHLIDVIGIYLDDEHINYDVFDDVQTYFTQVLKCILRGLNLTKLEFYKNYTIHIKCLNGMSTNWNITKEQKNILFKQGYDEAKLYCVKF